MSVRYLTTANGLNSINLKHANKWLRPHQKCRLKDHRSRPVQSVNAILPRPHHLCHRTRTRPNQSTQGAVRLCLAQTTGSR